MNRMIEAAMKSLEEYFGGQRALVVGGRGFIGSHVVNSLLDAGALVTTLSLSEPAANSEYRGAEHLTADVRNSESLREALAGKRFDYVVNSGGYIDHTLYFSRGRDLIEQHFLGTMNLLDLIHAQEIKGYVQLGSSDEYGLVKATQRENAREMPISPYSVAKVASTHLVQMLFRTEKIPGVVIRLFLVYGPGQSYNRFLPQVIRGCLTNKAFETSEGKQLRDFCYVEDVAAAILLALVTKAAHGKVINVASGQPVTIREVINKVVGMVNGGKPDFGQIPYRAGENIALYADIQLAKEILGWQPVTTLDEGLRKTILWYRKRLELEG